MIPEASRRYVIDLFQDDGYRLHINPDGTAVFIEGLVASPRFLLGGGAGEAIDRYVANFPEYKLNPWEEVDIEYRKHLRKLQKIDNLEKEYTGEERW